MMKRVCTQIPGSYQPWPGLLLFLSLLLPQPALAAKCLFLSSYHQGYAWSDGIEHGVRSVLAGHCELRQFDMDTKRHKTPPEIEKKALEARALIDTWQPDVVIAADDNAAQYVVMPFYKDHHIPFVFCGINWTVEEYGFPYRNVTGMIEVAPVEPLFDKAQALLQSPRRAVYLGANTETEQKNLQRVQEEAARRGIHLEPHLVETSAAWLAAFRLAQNADFIVLGSKEGINDWDDARVQAGVQEASRRLSLTNHDWMMPYAMLGFTKFPEEQGEWAAQTALHILAGASPATVPIVPNRKWDIWANTDLLATTDIHLSKQLLQKAKKVY
jgi:ABC-type uncharacterized transport system substrate-binding protein